VTCVRQQKHEFIKQRQQQDAMHQDADKTDNDDAVTAEELSQFYKQFLDNNYELHRNYNRFVAVALNSLLQ